MARKEFTYKGFSKDQLKTMSAEDFAKITTARVRRSIGRGFTESQKKLIANVRKANNVKTHCRNMVILPEFIDKTIQVHTGKEFQIVTIMPEMLGQTLGEMALTRKKPKHSVGAKKDKGIKRK